jgi:hypothetical protein
MIDKGKQKSTPIDKRKFEKGQPPLLFMDSYIILALTLAAMQGSDWSQTQDWAGDFIINASCVKAVSGLSSYIGDIQVSEPLYCIWIGKAAGTA